MLSKREALEYKFKGKLRVRRKNICIIICIIQITLMRKL